MSEIQPSAEKGNWWAEATNIIKSILASSHCDQQTGEPKHLGTSSDLANRYDMAIRDVDERGLIS